MAALQYVHVPGYAALLFRRSYADLSLPGALMDRANDWLRGTDAKWNATTKTWLFPSGATLTFGYLETENDKYRYQGAELNFIGFDELTQFSETSYRYLLSRLRREGGSVIPSRMRAASNPGGIGHEWVRARFVNPGDPERPFIPARLEDNPHLDLTDYEASLALLDPVTRAQLRAGDWDVLPEGRLFKREWFPVVEPRDVPANLKVVRFWDLAATEPKLGHDPDWTAGVKLGRTEGGTFYVLDVRRARERPQGVETLILRTAGEDGAAVPIWMEQEPGSSGVGVIDYYTRHVLGGYTFRGLRSTGLKEVRAGPVSSQAEAGNVKLVRGAWVGAFLDEIGAFPTEGVHDDQVDALSGAHERLAIKRATKVYAL
jgi:predicted phage terminase large subunit-like protein